MAEAVAQIYKAITDAKAGHYPHWQPSDRPIYPVVVTLEEWFLFSPEVQEILRQKILEAFAAEGLDADLLSCHPYTVCEIEDLEYAVQVMMAVGVATFWGRKARKAHSWNLHAFMLSEFRQEVARIQTVKSKDAFPSIFKKLKEDAQK